MRTNSKLLALVVVGGLALSACGSGETLDPPDSNPDAPLLQVHSEGGFVPVEWSLGNGPTFTLTRGGDLIYRGVTTLEYPGRLIPPYFVGELSDDQMTEIMGWLDEMGISEIDDEHDDSVTNVADASTEVIRYWDASGTHRYSVYALGITDRPANDATAAFAELFDFLHQVSASIEGTPYMPERVQVIAGADYQGQDPEFVDIRDWPLESESPEDWPLLTTVGESLEWTCKVFDPADLGAFDDATQATRWMHPSQSGDAQNYQLLVRPLLPGEDGCTL